MTNYLKLNKQDVLCTLHVDGHLQRGKRTFACVSFIVLSINKYSQVQCVFKDSHEEAAF